MFRPQTGYYADIKRMGFAATHTFLLMNGVDLDVSSKSAGDFIIKTIPDGKFRFALLHDWIARYIVPLLG